jgi:hypothetical protein
MRRACQTAQIAGKTRAKVDKKRLIGNNRKKCNKLGGRHRCVDGRFGSSARQEVVKILPAASRKGKDSYLIGWKVLLEMGVAASVAQ